MAITLDLPEITDDFGAGGAGLTPGGYANPDLRTILRGYRATLLVLAAAINDLSDLVGDVQDQIDGLDTPSESTHTAGFTAVARRVHPVNPTGGAFAVVLPTAVGLGPDDAITLVNVSASTTAITVSTTAAQTINGISTYGMNLPYQVVSFIPMAGNWVATPGAS